MNIFKKIYLTSLLMTTPFIDASIANTIVDSIIVGAHPQAVAISGSYAYVCNTNDDSVSVVNLTTQTISATITSILYPFSHPAAIAISGSYAYVCNGNGNFVSIVNIATPASAAVTGIVAATLQAFNSPQAIAISGTHAYVCNYNNNTVSIVNIATPASAAVTGIVDATVHAFNTPCAIAISGTTAYVCNYNNNIVSIVNIATPASAAVTGVVTDSGLTFNHPCAIVISGTTAYVSNDSAFYLSVINVDPTSSSLSYNSVIGTVENTTYDVLSAGAIAADGKTGYFCDSVNNSLQVLLIGVSSSVQSPASIALTTGSIAYTNYTNYINKITWTAPDNGNLVAAYRIYKNSGLTDLLATISADNELTCYDNFLNHSTSYTYYIVSVDLDGNVSTPISASITTR